MTAPATAPRRALVARDAELRVLADALAAAATGSRLALVAGEQGVGKSALVEAFAAAVADDPGVVLVRGFCLPVHGEGLPFGPMAGVLQGIEARFGADRLRSWAGGGAPALGVLLPHLAEPGAASAMTALQLFDAVARTWRGAAAAVGRLVVVVEDLHWADESSRALLQFLTRALADAPVLVIGTFRSDEVDRRHPLRTFTADVARLPGTVRVPLGRLGRDQVAEMLAMIAGAPPPADLLDSVLRRSGGIPFYVEELAGADAADGLPETVRDVVGARIHRMSPAAQELVRVAAVGGLRVPHAVLLDVLGGDAGPMESAAHEAVDGGVLQVDGDAYVFRHAIFAEAAGADLLPGKRARLHAAYAEALDRLPDPAAAAQHAAALHWVATGDPGRAFPAVLACARSGSVARAEVHQMYERALDMWDAVPAERIAGPRAGVLTEAAEAATDAGEWERALELLGQALDQTAPDDLEGRIDRLILRSQLRSDMLRADAGRDAAEAERALAGVVDEGFRARTWGRLARLALHIGDDARLLARAAVDAAEQVGDVLVEAGARITLGTAMATAGEEEAGLAELQLAGRLPVDDVQTRLRLHVNLSDALHLAGRFSEAAETALAGLEYSREHGIERSFGAYVAGNAAESLLATGAWGRARELIDAAIALDPPGSLDAHLRLLLAWLALWQGRTEEAREGLDGQRGLFGGGRQPQFVVQAMRIDAEHAVLTGDHARAWAHVLRLAEHPETFDVPRRCAFLAVGAAAAAALDRAAPAGRREMVEGLLAATPPCATRAVWAALADAELADDVAAWDGAVLAARRPTAPAHLLPYSLVRLAERQAADGERAGASSNLEEALRRAADLGAQLLVDRARGLAARLGLPGPAGAAGAGGPLGRLTSRELQVLRLVAEGRTNGQIAAALFISAKTASVHVSNILAKLGVAGRGEAAAVAHRAGLLVP